MLKKSDEKFSGGKNMVKKLSLVGLVAFACVLAAPVHATTVVAQVYGGTAPFTLESLGTETGFTAAPYVGQTTANPLTGGESYVVAPLGSSQTGTLGTYPSGVYAGSGGSIAASPFGDGTTEYLVAQPGGTVTINFSSVQTSIDLLWGSIDNGSVGALNLLTSGGYQLTGTMLLQDLVNEGYTPTAGTTGAYVEISGLAPFTSYTIQDTGVNSAFEFVPGTPVSEAGTLGMLGAGLIGLIALGGFRRRSLVSC
jgi:hypothetical protein